jgi:hypothetical protein
MAGLVPAIHVFARVKAWIPGTCPGMTVERNKRDHRHKAGDDNTGASL